MQLTKHAHIRMQQCSITKSILNLLDNYRRWFRLKIKGAYTANMSETVTDCSKCRNNISLDVALEVLREAWKESRVTMNELWRYARVCRVANVMRPYPESMA